MKLSRTLSVAFVLFSCYFEFSEVSADISDPGEFSQSWSRYTKIDAIWD